MVSRVANNPIHLPAGVEVNLSGQQITVKGKKGTLTCKIHSEVNVFKEDNNIKFAARNEHSLSVAQAGTSRAIVNNLVMGVTNGFEKKLLLVGVGYRAQVQGKFLNLTLGFSHPVAFPIPEGITIEMPSQTEIIVKGISKELVGQTAANIRNYRKVEPYKGKGVRYSTETVILKEVKKK